MIQSIYIFLGLIALVTSGVAISQRFPIDITVGASAGAFILWTIWGMSSYKVEVVTNTGTVVDNQYLSLVLMGLVAGGTMLIFAIWHVMTMFGVDPKRLLAVRL